MKIVQVTPRYPPRTGGVETHVKEISERFVERGHDVLVITADAGDDVPTRETRNGVVVERHRGFAPDGTFHIAPGITRAIRREDADVVHTHNYHSLPLFFAALGVTDEKFVVTPHYHGASASSFRDRLLLFYKPFGGWSLRQADEIIAVSEWEQEQLRNDFGVEATVIPNGLDVERFANAEPEERGRPYLLSVGRLEEYKGVQHIIRALPELPEFGLVIAGNGPYREELEKIAEEEGMVDSVDFLGYVDDKRLPGLYAGADVYVTLSEFEAYGITVGEALAAGTPCVVREEGALIDWTGHSGTIGVSSVSPTDIEAAIRRASAKRPKREQPSWADVTDCIIGRYDAGAERNKNKGWNSIGQ